MFQERSLLKLIMFVIYTMCGALSFILNYTLQVADYVYLLVYPLASTSISKAADTVFSSTSNVMCL